ncbi:MAG: hypothetical protein RDU20_13355 [Desulfomonilaceae bacterium]|nr:hypothetical protein [Desulfomonilaceae bacterium]
MTRHGSRQSLESDTELQALFKKAWNESRARHGSRLTVHVPGMFVVNGIRGRYRAVSITGSECLLNCEHCKGTLLKTMPHARDADTLLRFGLEAAERGDVGMLVTGGSDRRGRLPWRDFVAAIERLKSRTDLTITVHSGIVDENTAVALKNAGVDQALVDVIGDETTAREVYHLDEGTAAIRRTMDSLAAAGLEIVPHILYGLYFGRPRGETAALEMLKDYPLRKYVVVVLMPTKGTPMADASLPRPEEAARFIAHARLQLPDLHASLGCAKPRGHYRRDLDVLAVRAGVNALALPSERALQEAQHRGLEIVHRETCCSLG